MNNTDDSMDRLLLESMADDAPKLSTSFDAAVMDRVRERRLPPWGRIVMAAYAVGAIAFSVWALHDLTAILMAVSLGGGALVAFALKSYAHAVAIERG